MKVALALVLAIVIGLGYSAPPKPLLEPEPEYEPTCSVSLKPLGDKYIALLDIEEIENFIRTKLETGDPDFLAFIAYQFGDDAEEIVNFLWDHRTFTKLIQFLYVNGLTDIYNKVNEIHKIFGWREVSAYSKRSLNNKPPLSFGDLLEEFLKLIPVDQFINLTLELFVENDPALLCFYAKMRQTEMATLWKELKQFPPVVRLIELLREKGVEIDALIIIIESLFNWNRESHASRLYKFNLQPALQKIIDVIRMDKLKEYLQEVQHTNCGKQILSYLRGPQFDKLIKDFYAEKGFRTVLDWIQANGIDGLYEFLSELHKELGVPQPPYPKITQKCTQEEWIVIREDLNEFIPQDQITDVAYDLISNDDSIQELLKLLASNYVESSYHQFKSKKSYQNFLAKLRTAGFQIDKLVKLVEALMGWDNRPRALPQKKA